MIEFLLTLKDIVLNVVTLGWYGRNEGAKSSNAYVVKK